MKRKASPSLDSDTSAKLIKEPDDRVVKDASASSVDPTATTEAAQEPSKPATGRRERKAPAWLAGYVTDGTITVKELPKPAGQKAGGQSKKKVPKTPPSQQAAPGLKLSDVGKKQSSTQGSTEKLDDTSAHPSSGNTLIKGISDISGSRDAASDIKAAKNKPKILKQPGKQSLSSSSSTSLSSSKVQMLKGKPVPKLANKISPKRNITAKSSIHVHGVDAKEFNSSNVMEVCDTKNVNVPDVNVKRDMISAAAVAERSGEREKPTMLEIVVCISTSGAMGDYLTILQEKTREMVWRLQSLIPNLRVGVFAHTQGGIHDDKPGSNSSVLDHNYIRTGGHSGTKWLDLGATFSQICAFVDSLQPEATVYPDYVQDNLEMALWKLQRCMSWSSCSYRTVLMIGRGRPNRTSFYLQREHWRGWIRSALEIGPKADIPIVDWELEAKLLAQMGIHVFTIQAISAKTLSEEEEDEGSVFFRRVAEITNGLHFQLTNASNLIDIMVGVCCACHGPDLLQDHRDTLRDGNDGVLPPQLKDIIVALQLHSKRTSLSTIPSLVGDLSIMQQQLKAAETNGNISSSGGEETSGDEEEQLTDVKTEDVKSEPNMGQQLKATSNRKNEGGLQKNKKNAKSPRNPNGVSKAAKVNKSKSELKTSGKVGKNKKLQAVKSKEMVKKAVKTISKKKDEEKTVKKSTALDKVENPKTSGTPSTKASSESSMKTEIPTKMRGVRAGKVEKAKAKVKVAQAKVMKAKTVAKLIPTTSPRPRGRPPKSKPSSADDSGSADKIDSKEKQASISSANADGKSGNSSKSSKQNSNNPSTVSSNNTAVARRTVSTVAAKPDQVLDNDSKTSTRGSKQTEKTDNKVIARRGRPSNNVKAMKGNIRNNLKDKASTRLAQVISRRGRPPANRGGNSAVVQKTPRAKK